MWDAYRQRPLQTITSLITAVGVLLGVAFTAFGLVYTARTLAATQEGQYTDRYTKAIEQLAHHAVDVRLGALYALQRIAVDSPRDRLTIRNVLAAYVRNHDSCAVKPQPQQCDEGADFVGTGLAPRLPADVQTAFTIASTLTAPNDDPLDFSLTRFPYTDLQGAHYLRGVNLRDSYLRHANLSQADLREADLRKADMINADLREARLQGADLTDTDLAQAFLNGLDLRGADLHATILAGANLDGADLRGADLHGTSLGSADLHSANLAGADLTGTDLTGANLTAGTDLTGAKLHGAKLAEADLRGAKGMTPGQIRKVAITDATTMF